MSALNAAYGTLRDGKHGKQYAETAVLHTGRSGREAASSEVAVAVPVCRGCVCRPVRWHRLSPVPGAQALAPQSSTHSRLHRHPSGSSGVCGLPVRTLSWSPEVAGARRCLNLALREVAWSRSRFGSFLLVLMVARPSSNWP